MGAFDTATTITIPRSDEERQEWGWDPGETVQLKNRLSVADQKFTANRMGETGKNGELKINMGDGRFAILERMIVSWTLTGNGQIIPLNAHTIDQLPSTYSTPILSVIDSITAGMSKEEQENFLNSVNGHIVESSDSAKWPLKTL